SGCITTCVSTPAASRSSSPRTRSTGMGSRPPRSRRASRCTGSSAAASRSSRSLPTPESSCWTMGFVKTYALPRLIQWAVVIFVGTTVTFIIPRLLPTDPVEQTLRRVSTSLTDPRAAETLRNALQDLYGLQGTPLEQYGRFWARLVRADLGPSLGAFPTPVTQIIRDGLPW